MYHRLAATGVGPRLSLEPWLRGISAEIRGESGPKIPGVVAKTPSVALRHRRNRPQHGYGVVPKPSRARLLCHRFL
jgi:hypothetical protein